MKFANKLALDAVVVISDRYHKEPKIHLQLQ